MRNASFTVGELAKITSSKIVGDPEHKIAGVANLERQPVATRLPF